MWGWWEGKTLLYKVLGLYEGLSPWCVWMPLSLSFSPSVYVYVCLCFHPYMLIFYKQCINNTICSGFNGGDGGVAWMQNVCMCVFVFVSVCVCALLNLHKDLTSCRRPRSVDLAHHYPAIRPGMFGVLLHWKAPFTHTDTQWHMETWAQSGLSITPK